MSRKPWWRVIDYYLAEGEFDPAMRKEIIFHKNRPYLQTQATDSVYAVAWDWLIDHGFNVDIKPVKYELRYNDVWGNAADGWEVNDYYSKTEFWCLDDEVDTLEAELSKMLGSSKFASFTFDYRFDYSSEVGTLEDEDGRPVYTVEMIED